MDYSTPSLPVHHQLQEFNQREFELEANYQDSLIRCHGSIVDATYIAGKKFKAPKDPATV